MGSGEGGDRLPVACETQACFQFIGHELEVGRFLKGQELLEECDGLGRPVRPMVAARELGGKSGAVSQPAGAEPVKVGLVDPKESGGCCAVDVAVVKLLQDVVEKRGGQTSCDLIF